MPKSSENMRDYYCAETKQWYTEEELDDESSDFSSIEGTEEVQTPVWEQQDSGPDDIFEDVGNVEPLQKYHGEKILNDEGI